MDAVKLSHVHQGLRYLVHDGASYVLPAKAYHDSAWLNSHGAKNIRILCEITEPEERFAAAGVANTILFFGSARAKSPEDHAAAVSHQRALLATPGVSAADAAAAHAALARLDKTAWMSESYSRVEELARLLTKWSMGRIGKGRGPGVPFIVSTGGGPGLMEAANRGAASVPGALTAGIAISLPFESGLNSFVTPELSFQHHYFFTRKLHLCALARALIACPGGFGTFDELFEVLTLLQSGKIEHAHLMPIVLFGEEYWRETVNWGALLARGVIAQSDLDRLFFTSSPGAAFEHITRHLLQWEAAAAAAALAAADAAKTAAVSAAAAAYTAAARAAATAARHEEHALHAPPPGGGGGGSAPHATPRLHVSMPSLAVLEGSGASAADVIAAAEEAVAQDDADDGDATDGFGGSALPPPATAAAGGSRASAGAPSPSRVFIASSLPRLASVAAAAAAAAASSPASPKAAATGRGGGLAVTGTPVAVVLPRSASSDAQAAGGGERD